MPRRGHAIVQEARIEYCDKDMTGLYVLVSSKSNIKSYFLRYKDTNGKTCHQKLGRTGDMDLDEARRRAKTLKAELLLGVDRWADEKAKKAVLTLDEFFREHYPVTSDRGHGRPQEGASLHQIAALRRRSPPAHPQALGGHCGRQTPPVTVAQWTAQTPKFTTR